MNAPPPATALPPLPAQLPLLLFWARFHALRSLRRPTTQLWLLGTIVLIASLRAFGSQPPRELVDLEVSLLLPLLAMLLGTGGLREEVEDQTLTYAFVRPLDRGWIFVARVLSSAMVVGLPVLAGVLLATSSPLQLARDVGVALLGTVAYASVFALLGLVLRRPTLVGLGVLAWEQIASGVPGFLSRLTLRAHLRALLEFEPGSGLLAMAFRPPPWWASLPLLVLVTTAALALGVWWVRHRELVVPK